MDYISLGIRIKRKRLEMNLTQESLAELSKISTPYMGQIERGEKGISLENFVNIANALECSTDELLRDNMEDNINARISEIQEIIKDISPSENKKLIEIMKIFCNK